MKTFLLKWMFCLMAAIGLALAFSACSDDDDDKEGDPQENGQEEINIDSNVVILPKKVIKIVETYEGDTEYMYTFNYDDQDRLSMVFHGGDREPFIKFTYSKNQIVITGRGSEEYNITLKDGKVVSDVYRCIKSTFSYSGNCLFKVDCQDNCDEGLNRLITYSIVWKNGNWSSVNYTEEINGPASTDIGSYTYEWSNVVNNANLDLYGWLSSEGGDDAFFLGTIGTRCQNMPSKMTRKWVWTTDGVQENAGSSVITYDYIVDSYNYIIKIIETSSSATEGERKCSYIITYE